MVNVQKHFSLRAVPRAYMGLVGIVSIPFLLSLAVVVKGQSGAYELLAWAALLPAYWAIWLAWFRLEVDRRSIRYRRPFRMENSLQWEDVASVEVKAALSKRVSRVTAPLSMVVVTSADRTKRLVINTRVFPMREMEDCVAYMQSMIEDRGRS
jgi:hypothetical protein